MKPAEDRDGGVAQFLRKIVSLHDQVAGTFHRTKQGELLARKNRQVAESMDAWWRAVAQQCLQRCRIKRIARLQLDRIHWDLRLNQATECTRFTAAALPEGNFPG